VAGDHGFGFGVNAQLAGIAIVVDVVGAVGSKEEWIGRGTGVALGFVVAAVGVDHVVLDERVAEAGGGEGEPRRRGCARARVGVEGVVGVGRTPGLIAQHGGTINVVDVGQRCAAQQLIAAAVALGLVLVLEVAFEDGCRT
jgi:hypothetical protein